MSFQVSSVPAEKQHGVLPSLVTDICGSGCSVFNMVDVVVLLAVAAKIRVLRGLSLLPHCPGTATAQFHPQSLQCRKESLVAASGQSLCSHRTALLFSLSRSH